MKDEQDGFDENGEFVGWPEIEVDLDEEGEPDEFLSSWRDGYITGYEDGVADGRLQGKEAAMFLVKTAFKDYYDTEIQEIVERLESSW